MNRRLLAACTAVSSVVAVVPLLLASLLRRQLPGGSGPHAVASLTRQHSQDFAYRVFYPTSDTTGSKGCWLPRPIHAYARGLGSFLRLPEVASRWILPLLAVVRGGWFEVTPEGPPMRLPPAGVSSGIGSRKHLPVVIFSHGIGGTQTMYSGWCVELASQGYVVVAVEHSDASASATLVASGQQDGPFFYQHPTKQLIGADGGYSWRHGQQEVRVGQLLTSAQDMLHEAATDAASPWHNRLDSRNVFVAGHSFGGASAVAASASAASVGRDFGGFRAAVILDGWLWPLCGDAMDTRCIDRDFGAADQVPLLFLDAESFLGDSRWWAPKAELVRRCSGGGQASALLSLRHAVHFSFSDVFVLGERAFSVLSLLRQAPSKSRDRQVVTAEVGVNAVAVGKASSAVVLLAESAKASVAFFNAHLTETEESAWSSALSSQAWRVLEADSSLGLTVETQRPRAKL